MLASGSSASAPRFCRMEATTTAARQPQLPGLHPIQGLPAPAATQAPNRGFSTGRVWSELQHAEPWQHRRRAAGCQQQQALRQLQGWRGFASRAQEAAAAQRQRLAKKSGEQGLYLVALVVGMVGLTYASVPLYRRAHSSPSCMLHEFHLLDRYGTCAMNFRRVGIAPPAPFKLSAQCQAWAAALPIACMPARVGFGTAWSRWSVGC